MKKRRLSRMNFLRKYKWCITGLGIVIAVYFIMISILGIHFFESSVYDSYTLQALAWRDGSVSLLENYPGLEIAVYQNEYFLSFPPFPSVPMFFLSLFFGANTPSLVVMLASFVGSYVCAYKITKHFGATDVTSMIWGVFLLLGSNFLSISLYGWVWHMAQSLSFLFLLICILCLLSPKRFTQGVGLIVYAFSIGCRPINAVYLPIILYWIYKQNKQSNFWKTLKRTLPMLIIPALIAVAYGTYNYVRFDNPFEFGHNYLPEFQEYNQFGLEYIPKHLKVLFTTFPTFENGQLSFPLFNGFAFYIANPIFLILFIRLFRKPKLSKIDLFLWISLIVHFLLLCTHSTFGGWQFGTRYLIDVIPVAFLLCVRRNQKLQFYEILIMACAIGINLYGPYWFRFQDTFPAGLQ